MIAFPQKQTRHTYTGNRQRERQTYRQKGRSTHINKGTHTCVCIHTNTHTRAHVCSHACVRTYTCAHAYTRAHNTRISRTRTHAPRMAIEDEEERHERFVEGTREPIHPEGKQSRKAIQLLSRTWVHLFTWMI